ncbi:MAG: hypothetical protein HKN76_06040, partial [Saprospiraceae bacterium]|nr:hypothetical protein [Saprospiraceae bacterium]
SRSVQNLTGLVYDVLDHQKLIEGRLSLQLRPCNIGNVIEEIHKNYQFESLKKGLDFQLMCEEVLSTQEYLMDPLRLSQILTNLVINAIKYTDKGSIIMEACLISKAPGGYLEVTVSDTGVGIDEESLSQINTGKYQHGPVISGRYGSYGLGLSIVKQLVHLLGGKFKATSTIGVGSRFKVSLPIEPAENHHLDLPKVHPEKTLPSLSEQKVIVQLDDDISSLELFSHLIRSGQIKLIQFTRFDQMLEGLDRFRPHVVVSDLMLNEKHYTRELRMAIENRKISCPVIVVSAQEVEQSRNISPYAFQKPFDPGLLLDQIYTILGEKQYQKPIFKSIYDNYDFDTVKIERALTLLESEFLSLIPKLRELPASNSLDSWQLISHKLITHLRSLQMEKIEKIMARTDCIPNESTLGYLIDSLYYSLCAIRLEKWINSRD